jgi:hypothetical protein
MMTRAFGRAAAAAILAALFGAAWAALLYAWRPALTIDFDRDLPRNVSGIYPAERDEAAGLTFAWTGSEVTLRLPGLDRRANWTLDLRVRGARSVASENPALSVVADGLIVSTEPTTRDFSDLRVVIPSRGERRGLTLNLRPSATFVPGPADARALGVMLDRMSLTPDRVPLVPRPALTAASLSSAAMGAALALLGVTAGSAIGGAVLLSAAVAAVVGRGFGPFTDYPSLALSIAIALATFALAAQQWRGLAFRNTARFAAAFSACALFLKLLILVHPDMAIGDAMFHAHRFQGVLAGRYYFTSIAPGGYAFPYPPGLYVFASIFAGLIHRGAADVTLLRIVTCAADALAGLLLYAAIVHAPRDAAKDSTTRLAAAIAVAIYHLVPVGLAVLTTGNLTNAFAQSVAVGALVLMAIDRTRLERRAWTLALTATLAAAYLSHTGTLAILFAATVLIALLFLVRGGASLRSPAAAVAVATVGAAVLAVVVYYAHFLETYRTELARIGHETATAASDAGGRTVADRLRIVPYSVSIYIGLPVLLVALLGTVHLVARHGRERLTLVFAGWILSCLLFLVIGILTPVDMRYYLASVPALAIAAGFGAAWAWSGRQSHDMLWRVAAGVLLAAAISTGVRSWWAALG